MSSLSSLASPASLKSGAAAVAAFLLAYYVARPLLKIILQHFVLTKVQSLRRQLKKFGSWAVVTGATDGIGKAYAELLAKDGLNIVLISRSQEKLQDTATELQEKYKVQTKIIVADFAKLDIYEGIASQLSGLDIACLVNNVGIGNPHPNFFSSQKPEQQFDMSLYCNMLHVNCLSMIRMTRIVLEQMQARQEQRGGAIINVASGSGISPTPLLSVYSATKAFAIFFSQSLATELGHSSGSKRFVVQTIAPFFVATKLSKIRRASFMAPTPKSFVNEALNLLGVQDFSVGCFAHDLQLFAMRLVPEFLSRRLTFSMLSGAMRAALRKAAKNKDN